MPRTTSEAGGQDEAEGEPIDTGLDKPSQAEGDEGDDDASDA